MTVIISFYFFIMKARIARWGGSLAWQHFSVLDQFNQSFRRLLHIPGDIFLRYRPVDFIHIHQLHPSIIT